ncbi:MAG: competence/damage-inducible protein A [Acidobacteria bacterium]|nr:MAG: competence/damage-inducible protein A [Acidobacteriota bacterium]
MEKNAEIIAVGSELLTPNRTDTNSLYLTEQLNSIGIEVEVKTIVGDSENRLEQVLREAIKRSELVITTGGLGPTEDDITKKVVARVIKKQMVLEERILERIRFRFRSRGLEMPANNARQALVPVGARILENPVGTAPGLWIEHEGCHILVLPGPPRELQVIFEESCMPRLSELSGGTRLATQVFKVIGLTESRLDEMIAPIYTRYKNPATTILAAAGEIHVHLIAKGKSDEDAKRVLTELADKIEYELGDFVFSRGEESLEQIVGYYLLMRQMTLAVAESCTGGLISQRITSVPGSSSYFLCGVTCYSNASKIELAGIPPLLIEMNGAVSQEVAKGLAEGIRLKTGATIGLGVTGIAGPAGGSVEKPVGLVHIALSLDDTIEHQEHRFGGDRERIRLWASQAALDMVRRKLI